MLKWIMGAALMAGPTFEIGEPMVLDDLGPMLRACDRGDADACGEATEIAFRAGNFKFAEHLALRACQSGAVSACQTDKDRCAAGMADACRAVDASQEGGEMASAEGLLKACAKGKKRACLYLDEYHLRDVDVRFVRWEPRNRVRTSANVAPDILVSPDGRTVLVEKQGRLNYYREGKPVGAIELPDGLGALLGAGSWSRDELLFVLYRGFSKRLPVGLYRNGAFEPLPEAWTTLPSGVECRDPTRMGSVLFRNCKQGRGAAAKLQFFRIRESGEPLPPFELPPTGYVVGEGLKPGGLIVYFKESPFFYVVGPEDNYPRPLSNPDRYPKGTALDSRGRMWITNGYEVARYTPTGKLKWSERVARAQLTLGLDGWLWNKNESIGESRRNAPLLRLEDGSGPRTPWFRADLLAGYITKTRPHAAGFLVQGDGRGVVIRAPWVKRWPKKFVQPRGKLKRMPGARFTARQSEPSPFKTAWHGWPEVGGPLAPADGELRPQSMRMQDVPGAAEALVACADGSFEGCASLRRAGPRVRAGAKAIQAIGKLPCTHFKPHTCPPPADLELPPEFAVQGAWLWSDLMPDGHHVLELEWDGDVPVVWTTTSEDRFGTKSGMDKSSFAVKRPRYNPADPKPKFYNLIDTQGGRTMARFDDDTIVVGEHAMHVPGIVGGRLRADGGVTLWAWDGVVGWKPGTKRAVVTSVPSVSHAVASSSGEHVLVYTAMKQLKLVDALRGKVIRGIDLDLEGTPDLRFTSDEHFLVCFRDRAWAGSARSGFASVDKESCQRARYRSLGDTLYTFSSRELRKWEGDTLKPLASARWGCEWLVPRGESVLCGNDSYLTWFGPTPTEVKQPVARTRPTLEARYREPIRVRFPKRAFYVSIDDYGGQQAKIRFDDGVVRTVDLTPFDEETSRGTMLVPWNAKMVEMVFPKDYVTVTRNFRDASFDPGAEVRLRVSGPDGPATKSRALYGSWIDGTDIIDLGLIRRRVGESVTVMDEAGNMGWANFVVGRDPSPVPVRLYRPESPRVRKIPVREGRPNTPLFYGLTGTSRVPRNAVGDVLGPNRFLDKLYYDVAPGVRAEARIYGNEYHVGAGAWVLHTPFLDTESARVEGHLLEGDAKGVKPRLYAQTSPDPIAAPLGRWLLKAIHPNSREVRWAVVEVKPGSQQEVFFAGRSRQVQLTVYDRAGWPRPQKTRSDVAGRLRIGWIPVESPVPTTMNVPGVPKPLTVTVPPGEDVYRFSVELEIAQ